MKIIEIYRATNQINGKIYIGQTTINTEHRKDGHFREARSSKKTNTYFHNAINKYGSENFQFECIDTATDIDELNNKEEYWIRHYGSTNDEIGYNLDSGGGNNIKSESTRRKIGIETKKDWDKPELAKRMREGLNKATKRWVEICEENQIEIICEYCSQPFKKPPHMAHQRYCSRSCSAKDRKNRIG